MLLSGLHDSRPSVDILAGMPRLVSGRPLSRRSVLSGLTLGTAGLLTGCSTGVGDVDLSRLDPRSEPPTPTLTAELREPAEPDRDADLVTLSAVHAELLATTALLASVSQRHPRLRPVLAPVTAVHREHVAVLAGAAPEIADPGTPSTLPPNRIGAALALVRSTEETTQTRLAGWALEARSGTFARLLASMAGALAQQRSQLPAKAPIRSGANS